ncbi:MAG TPA: FHA domain-containing protein [Trebonia sp.]
MGETVKVPPLLVRTEKSNRESSGRTLTEAGEYRIGRDPASDIVVDDPRVSWRHAALRSDGSDWVLLDSGSRNGTFLESRGRKISGIVISVTCLIRLGDEEEGPLLRLEPIRVGNERPETARVKPAGRKPRPYVPAPDSPAPGEPARQAPVPQAPVPDATVPDAPAPNLPAPGVTVPYTPAPASHELLPKTLPSVDRRPSEVRRIPTRVTRIGRTPDNDVVVRDLSVSRRHAELRRSDAGFTIVDVGSHNGTFVNGARVTRAKVGENDIIAVGNATFRLAGGELRTYIDTGEVSLQARDLTVRAGRKVLLDSISFPIPERCLLAVIGPSGAGKSTLLGALTGTRPADSGTVLYDNRDLYREYPELRQRIGLVPQQSVMHTQLTPAAALKYAAELRFPSDTKSAERKERVTEVMSELGLSQHARTRADRLSGGQLKRVNVAMELLTKPSLLFLDEPTSGLDPGLDKSVMDQMRDLAHDGRTVIVVTHSVDNLDTCDRLLVLVPGGRIAYYGPPGDGLTYFGMRRWAEVFQAFEAQPDRDWAAEFQRSPEYERYVVAPGAEPPGHVRQPADPHPGPGNAAPGRTQSASRQTWTLARRYLRVISADRGFLLFSVLLPLLLGGLIRFVPSPEGLGGTAGTNGYAEELLLVIVIGACLAGAASSVRELVKERGIYLRERAAGLSCGAYMASKVLVLGVVSVVQAVLMTLIGLYGRELPSNGSVLANDPLAELMIGVAVLAFASLCLGLLISALVSTSEKAMPFLVALTMIQVVLSGAIFSLVGKAGLSQLAWLSPSRWGMGALGSTVSLNVITPGMAANPDTVWNHNAPTWLLNVVLTLILGAVLIGVATWRLSLFSPGRRR